MEKLEAIVSHYNIIIFFVLILCCYAQEDDNILRDFQAFNNSKGQLKKKQDSTEEFPYYATLRGNNNSDMYFGAIVSPNYVVTSAAAATSLGSLIFVHVGTLSNSFTSGKIYPATNITIHKDYDSSYPPKHNIALLRVLQPFQFDQEINFISLSRKFRKPEVKSGDKIIVPKCKNVFKDENVSLEIVSRVNCKNMTNYDKNKDHLVCANLFPEELQKLCFDRFGALVVADNSLMAIYSFHIKCDGSNCPNTTPNKHPVAFTKISPYRKWIVCNSDVQK